MHLSKADIITIPETKLVGVSTTMSVADNQTAKLWQTLMPRRSEISMVSGSDLYSVEIYPDTHFFREFSPVNEFQKWAAIPVTDLIGIPDGLNPLTISEGKYAKFHFKGSIQEAPQAMQYIFGEWLPNSGYQLDDRPHFAVMGEKYSNTAPDSEEDFYIPIR